MRIVSHRRGVIAAASLSIIISTTYALIPSTQKQQRRHASPPQVSFFGTSRRITTSLSHQQPLYATIPTESEEATATSSSAAPHHANSHDANAKIANELSLGKTLDNGPVIDFASVKDTSSRAEQALLAARQKYETGVSTSTINENTRLMGINDEVVAEVGYEIGNFVNEYVDTSIGEDTNLLVQKCARYLRSKATSSDTFPKLGSSNIEGGKEDWLSLQSSDGKVLATSNFTPDEISRMEGLIKRAYDESGIVTSAFAKTFYLGTQVLPEPAMKAIWAIYVWCRRTDEIVDAPRPNALDPNDEMLTDLSEWEIRLEQLFDVGDVVDVLDLPLLDCKVKYPSLPIVPFSDMIRGMLMDIPELGQERYDTWDELHLYCYRVAGTVGLMSMPVFGCAEGYTDEIAKEPALSLGVAFQITNILRDVGEDAEQRGRVYLPQQDMAKFGVTEQQLMDKVVDENYINLMKFEIARARMYYARALRGVPMLRPESRLPVQLSCDAYGKILDKIEENNYDSLTKRAYVGKWEKLAGIPASWYRTLDIAKMLPLPDEWDKPSLDEYEKQLEDILEKAWDEQK